MRSSLIVLTLGLFVITGCHSGTPTIHPNPNAAHEAAMLGPITQLAGDWEMTDEHGTAHLAARFAVTSAGSAVREIMFPGEPHEMTNLYHMDGGNLVLTHYCAAGNQPRMVASKAAETDDGVVFHFGLDDVSNLRASHDHYMGDMTLTILKSGNIRQDWRSYDREGNLTEPTVFSLSRRSANSR